MLRQLHTLVGQHFKVIDCTLVAVCVGGLSMFLRGELEKTAAPTPSSPSAPASAAGGSPAPAWASSKAQAAPAGATSLKDILSQEAAALAGAEWGTPGEACSRSSVCCAMPCQTTAGVAVTCRRAAPRRTLRLR